MDKKQILGAFRCGHLVIFSCECFCNPCEYMRSLSARWESQKSADAESPFLCLTFSCLQHFASRTGTKILAQVVKLPALTLFLPLHYHSHSLFHSSQAKSLRLQPTNVISQSCSTKQESWTYVISKSNKIACIGIKETMSLKHATVLNNWTLEGFPQNHNL